MNPKIKPVVYFCISAALWAIPSYYLRGTLFGNLCFYIAGIIPSFFLQACMFLPPIEKWVRYVPMPGILLFGAGEIIYLLFSDSLYPETLMAALLFAAAPLCGFIFGWLAYFFRTRPRKK